MKKVTLSILSLSFLGVIQIKAQDSIKQKSIDEVVITVQYNPQSINKSLYKVDVIDENQIRNMGATNAAEVLSMSLNMLIIPDSSSGNSTVNVMGLGGEYIKVLVDNIPIVNDEGLGNLIDLSKINLDNIERIEVVKGSMGVEYGSNAVAGVINIITKKSAFKKLRLNATLQEETVGSGYDLYRKGKGRHVQNLNIGYNLSKNWYVGVDFSHNDFQGFEGKQKGYKFFDEKENGLRGYDWQPKDLINANGILKYTKNSTTISYKVNYLTEVINYRNPNTQVINLGDGQRTFISTDRDYFTNRWIHQFNIATQLGGHVNYVGDFSYQTQKKDYQNYNYDVPNRKIASKEDKNTYYDIDTYYSRGVFSRFVDSEKFDFQLGYELDQTKGFASSFAGLFNEALERSIFNYSNFISAEWNPFTNFYVRPGGRLTVSDRLDNQYNYSLAFKYSIGKSDLRLSGGTANRNPSYNELFTYFVDANHDVQGNENLKAEKGYTGAIFWDYRRGDISKVKVGVSAMALHLKDRIEFLVVSPSPLKYSYVNVGKYTSLLYNAYFDYQKGQFLFNAGVSLEGNSRTYTDNSSAGKFFYHPEVKASINYSLKNTKTLFSIFYKYIGKSEESVLEGTDDNGNSIVGKGYVGDFSMMNASVSQSFFKNHLNLSIGVKNIFDVSDVKNTTEAGDIHTTASTTQNLFYGRSYYARLSYNF